VFGGNPSIMKTYIYPMSIHLRDHLLNYYLKEAHEAVEQAQTNNLIPEEANAQVQVIVQVQKFIEQQMGEFAQELGQIDQAAQQFRPQPQAPPDNSMQIAEMNSQIQQQALQQRAQSDQEKIALDRERLAREANLDQIKMQERQMALAEQQAKAQSDVQREQIRQNAEDQRKAADLTVRERMNDSDNETAMKLAELEILSGEKFSVSTGTGINPGG
jgi:hypothetical protein